MMPPLQFITFILLFAVVVALAYITSRFLGGRLGQGRPNQLLRIIATVPLGRDRLLLLVDVAGGYFLVGSGPQGISSITAIDDPEMIRRLQSGADNLPADLPPAAGFGRLLTKALQQFGPGRPPTAFTPPAAGTGSLQAAIDRLRTLVREPDV